MTAAIIDVHTHLAPALTEPVDGVGTDARGRLVIDGHRVGIAGLYDADRLATSLAGYGLDSAWVSAPPPTYRQGMDPAGTHAWVRALDAGMRRRIAGRPSLALLSYLPLDQPEVAQSVVAEIVEAEQAPGGVGWTACAGGASAPLDDAALDPLWDQLEEIGRPILLHPGESPDHRLDAFYLSNLLGNPVETAVAAGQLILGGVLARHSRLRIVLVHCGGVLPAVVGRWARGVSTQRPGIPERTADPRATVRGLWADTLAHSAAVLDLALAVFGCDRLVLGSDYPFPMGVDNPFESVAHLDPEVRAAIAGNAAALLDTGGAS